MASMSMSCHVMTLVVVLANIQIRSWRFGLSWLFGLAAGPSVALLFGGAQQSAIEGIRV